MPTSKPAFPAGIGESIHSPHCLLKGEQYGDELWIAEPTLDPHASNDHLLQVTPYKSDYQIHLNGHTAVPVTITGYRKSQRWWIQQLLREWSDDHGYRPWLVEQAQRRWCPGIFDANHFFTDRAIGPGGRSIELERDRSDWIRDGHGLLLPRIEADAMSDVELAEMFPESKLLRAQMFDLVRIPHMKPEDVRKRYLISLDPVLPRHATATLPQPVTNYSFPLRTIEEQTAVVAGTANAQQNVNGIGFNLHLDEIEEKSLDSDPNDLSAKIEKVLELIAPYGKVVGQVNPEATERVCFCIKQNHGEKTWLSKISASSFQAWIRHQNAMIDLQDMISTEFASENIYLFYEGVDNMENNETKFYKNEKMTRKLEQDLQYCEFLLQNFRGKNSQATEYDLLLSFHRSLMACNRFPCLRKFKDIAINLTDITYENRQTISTDRMHEASKSKDISTQFKIMLEDFPLIHLNTFKLLQSKVKKNCTGIVMLGGMHFLSNTPQFFDTTFGALQIPLIEKTFEEMAAQDPNLKDMRFIVIEPNFYHESQI